ncbi:MAG: transposase, partial [Endomicrobiia bacterium]
MFQQFLFKPQIISKEHLKKFSLLFSNLPLSEFPHHRGRFPLYPKFNLTCASIYKNLRGLATYTDLIREFHDLPDAAKICQIKLPVNKELFSSFIRDTPNSFFKSIENSIINELISLGQIKGEYLSTDSCPVFANIKENNFRTNVPHRFDKTIIPDGDPDATLSTYTEYRPEKKVVFFWGYRNHVINDTISELPVSEITKPNNIGGSTLFIPHLVSLQKTFNFDIKAVIADAEYDSYKNIEFVAKKLKAQPIIAKNPRAGSEHKYKISRTGEPICIAGIPMYSMGQYFEKDKNRWRHKFVCRIKLIKSFAQKQPFCPWNHPNFFNNKFGCVVNLRIDADTSIRKSINYDSQSFKKLYNLRTSSERVFSRLLTYFMQYPTVTGLNAVSNNCSIAHITVLLIAL